MRTHCKNDVVCVLNYFTYIHTGLDHCRWKNFDSKIPFHLAFTNKTGDSKLPFCLVVYTVNSCCTLSEKKNEFFFKFPFHLAFTNKRGDSELPFCLVIYMVIFCSQIHLKKIIWKYYNPILFNKGISYFSILTRHDMLPQEVLFYF